MLYDWHHRTYIILFKVGIPISWNILARNISNTIANLFAVTIFSMGSATAILVGQSLGAGELVTARRTAWKRWTTMSWTPCPAAGMTGTTERRAAPTPRKTDGAVRPTNVPFGRSHTIITIPAPMAETTIGRGRKKPFGVLPRYTINARNAKKKNMFPMTEIE